MASKEDISIIIRIIRAISKRENKWVLAQMLGLKKEDELLALQSYLFDQVCSEKEVYFSMLGISEEELVKKLEELGWRDLVWKERWESEESCGCCFTDHPAGFYGIALPCESGEFTKVPAKTVLGVLSKEQRRRTYQY